MMKSNYFNKDREKVFLGVRGTPELKTETVEEYLARGGKITKIETVESFEELSEPKGDPVRTLLNMRIRK